MLQTMRVGNAGVTVLAAATLGAAVLLSFPAEAQPRRGSQAYLIQLEGYLGAPRPKPVGTTELTLRHGGGTYRFQLSRLRVLVGSVSPSNVLTDIEALQQTLNLRGAQSMIDRLAGGAEAEQVTITGHLRRGSRELMVSEVTLKAAASATPAAARPAAPANE
jgi:hypothetical protein